MKNEIVTVLAAVLAILIGTGVHVTSENTIQGAYAEWKVQYGSKKLTYEQEAYRFSIFKKNVEQINQFNKLLGRQYTKGVNRFTCMTDEEFAASYLGKFESNNKIVDITKEEENGPTIDWVSYGAVSPVKNQGSACKSSYAFSAIGAIQAISVIYYKTPTEYSAQQLVDCSQSYGNNGCTSGNMNNCFNYIRDKGINTQAAYPYTGSLGTCRATSGLFKVKGYTAIQSGDCSGLANALASMPISVAVDGQNFRSYASGIFSNCGTNLSLGSLLVGMTDSWWTLKNDWGTSWGQAGYIRITRGNTCGVCQAASYPFV